MITLPRYHPGVKQNIILNGVQQVQSRVLAAAATDHDFGLDLDRGRVEIYPPYRDSQVNQLQAPLSPIAKNVADLPHHTKGRLDPVALVGYDDLRIRLEGAR